VLVKELNHHITTVDNEIAKTIFNCIWWERVMIYRAIDLLTFKSNIERGHCNASVEVILLLKNDIKLINYFQFVLLL